ncbi:hypothetical protein [Shimia sp.]|uniref:hypothetical protein n=1 Tax=Shimia sp. TaxID=1954381 RepID=UPI00329A7DEC
MTELPDLKSQDDIDREARTVLRTQWRDWVIAVLLAALIALGVLRTTVLTDAPICTEETAP